MRPPSFDTEELRGSFMAQDIAKKRNLGFSVQKQFFFLPTTSTQGALDILACHTHAEMCLCKSGKYTQSNSFTNFVFWLCRTASEEIRIFENLAFNLQAEKSVEVEE